jgi:3-hydroxyisobutyrate dehydrogenase-like beta-hydroxyacid dehydrogenase
VGSPPAEPGRPRPNPAHRARLPASLAAAVDILELCPRDDRDIWEVLGTAGVEDALRPGLIVVNHGTGDPGENREIAEHLAGKRVAYLDAPVSGGGAGPGPAP